MKQLANPYQILILPITMFIGAEQAFLAADYTAVSCDNFVKIDKVELIPSSSRRLFLAAGASRT